MEREIKYTEDYILLVDTNDKNIAYKKLNPEAKDLDLPLLPEFEDNIENLANNFLTSSIIHPADSYVSKLSFLEGYKTAQDKGTFTLEDMEKAIELARNIQCSRYNNQIEDLIGMSEVDLSTSYLMSEREIIQQIQQSKLPKGFKTEYIRVRFSRDDGYWEDFYVSKISTNSEGKEVLKGKWIY